MFEARMELGEALVCAGGLTRARTNYAYNV